MTLGCTKDPEENAICWLDTPATGKLDFTKMVKSRSRCFGDRVLLPCCGYTYMQRRIASEPSLLKKLTQQHQAQCPQQIGHCECIRDPKPCMSQDSATQDSTAVTSNDAQRCTRKISTEQIFKGYWSGFLPQSYFLDKSCRTNTCKLTFQQLLLISVGNNHVNFLRKL